MTKDSRSYGGRVEPDFEREGYMLSRDHWGEIVVCPECGAVVQDWQLHRDWHKENADLKGTQE